MGSELGYIDDGGGLCGESVGVSPVLDEDIQVSLEVI